MRFIIDIIMTSNQKRTYKIDAKDEDEAKDKLKLRLHPDDRKYIEFSSIEIDSSTIVNESPHGIFSED